MLRKILLAASVATAALLATQCGNNGGDKCPNGCTDSTGACVAGTTVDACGKAGTQCGKCSTGQQCSANTCVNNSAGGGTGGSTGGGTGTAGGTGGARAGGTGGNGGGTAGSGTGGGSGGATGQACSVSMACPVGSTCVADTQAALQASTGKCRAGCDTVLQNCPNNQKCTYGQVGTALARTCVDAGTLAEDATCVQANDQCGLGLVCLGFQGGGPTKCVKYCALADLASCNAGHSCNAGFNPIATGATEWQTVCRVDTIDCNLLTQNCPMSTQNCILASASSTACGAVGTTAINAPCTNPEECVKGANCIPTSTTTNNCLQLCNTDGGMPTCASGTCQGTTPALPQGAGICG